MTMPRRRGRGDLAVALVLATLRCIAWGLLAGISCGAVAGTVVFPGVGTMYGPIVGAYAGFVALVALTPVVLGVLLCHRCDHGAAAALRTTATVIVGAILVGTGGYVVYENPDPSALGAIEPWIFPWVGTTVVATTATLLGILRLAAASIAAGWCRALGLHPVLEAEGHGSVHLRLENAR